MSKSATVSPEINLIGKTVDEAIPELDKYLDDAYLAHLEKVRVVHGRGTGALRNGVHQHLRKLKYVKSFHLGNLVRATVVLPLLLLSKKREGNKYDQP